MRKYTVQKKCPHFVHTPPHITSEKDLQNLFEPLLAYVSNQKKNKRELNDQSKEFRPYIASTLATPDEKVLKNRITQIGAKIKLQWTKEETESSAWKSGWYVATVHNYCSDTDNITLTTKVSQITPMMRN